MTYLTVSIKVMNVAQGEKAIERAVAAQAEMVELRLDYMAEPCRPAVAEIVSRAVTIGKPIIATCRPVWEGGGFSGSENERQGLLAQAVGSGADYVDVELLALEKGSIDLAQVVGKSDVKVIVSYHDFAGAPGDLAKWLERIKLQHPAVSKIAYRAGERISDSFGALDIMHSEAIANNEVIAMAMGEAGVITRLLTKKLGAFLSFARVGPGDESAPGQITLALMKKTYLWDRVGRDTSVYGVIGYPVGHSMSPAIHNAAFEAVGYDGLYVPLLVEASRGEFFRFLDGVRERKWLGIRGLSVTIPHKHHALEYVRERGGELEGAAKAIGAVNTLLIDSNGKVRGTNTDYAGALEAVTEGLRIERKELQGVAAAVVGAGGVARAVVAGLTDAGAAVTIYNRTAAKARMLAEEFGCKCLPESELKSMEARLLVNCTSVGMYPETEGCPVPEGCLKKGMAVFDTVYNPMETKLLRYAREAGAQTVDGVSMFVNQAALQFEYFTGLAAPRELMRRVVEGELGRKKMVENG